MAESIADLTREIEKDKAAFNAARMRLAMLLGPAMPKPGAEEILIAHASENRLQDTLDACARNPGFFDLGHAVDQALAAKVSDALEDAVRLNERLVDLVATRTNLMMATKDPAYKPTYIWLGREFTIDGKMQTYTETDTGQTFAFLNEDDRPRPTSTPSKGMSR